ncbi:MAG: hypothetical protein IPM98_16115 [Lewinellaceae bacterium]|nr:hypothetical protein [Lewinellaceae bacterium]
MRQTLEYAVKQMLRNTDHRVLPWQSLATKSIKKARLMLCKKKAAPVGTA